MTRILTAFFFSLIFITNLYIFSQDFKFFKENLGQNVNSKYDELKPIISPDGHTLYFCRSDHPENIGYEAQLSPTWKRVKDYDIWYSVLQPDGTWSKAVNIGAPLNNINNNYVCSVSPDGNTLLLGGKYSNGDSVEKGVSISHRTDNGWSYPEALKIKNYYNLNKFVSFTMTSDGQKLIMAVQRDDSYGDKDLYVSFLQIDGTWSEPMHMGPVINTVWVESTPFLASDMKTLYFSSNRETGALKTDIFISKRLDDTWKNWSEPKNLGPYINTSQMEGDFMVPASGDFAYFVSTDNSFGGSDIYRIKTMKEFVPNPVVMIYGKVHNPVTKEPIEARIYYETLPDGKEIGTARSSPINGEYKIILPTGAQYRFRAELPRFIPINDSIDATNIRKYTEIERDLEFIPIEVVQMQRLNTINIYFDYDKVDLREDSYSELNRLVDILNDYRDLKIEISGHTDSLGGIIYNLNLSMKRAKAVADYIISKNVSKSRVYYKGFGLERPIADNVTEEGRQMNRRVEFYILK